MKNKIASIFAIIVYIIVVAACSKDDNNNSEQNSTVAETTTTAQSGSWKITYFFDSDHEETNHFTGYTFTFKEDGSLVAVKNSTTVTGTWSITDGGDSSDDDGGSDNDDFNIFFASPADFEDLSEDWEIVSVSDSKMVLTHVSGGNGGTDFLTFEKF